mmetsp:Transcript_47160/g.95044  ORF Transcript_47160/g.95044 Transcript_47160/m.95044 type:complete len:259 (-) Transcript_47160:329-1105(-)
MRVSVMITMALITVEAMEHRACTLQDVEGSFIFAGTGWKETGPTNLNRQPYASAGREHYDGKGLIKGLGTTSINGEISRRSIKGAYTVNSDCTVHSEYNDGSTKTLYLGENGSFVSWISTTPGDTFTSYYQGGRSKISDSAGCSKSTLEGNYLWSSGVYWTLLDEDGGWVPSARNGIESWDGDGNIIYRGTTSINGVAQAFDGSDVYSVDESCRISFEEAPFDYYTVEDGSVTAWIDTCSGQCNLGHSIIYSGFAFRT